MIVGGGSGGRGGCFLAIAILTVGIFVGVFVRLHWHNLEGLSLLFSYVLPLQCLRIRIRMVFRRLPIVRKCGTLDFKTQKKMCGFNKSIFPLNKTFLLINWTHFF